MVICISCGAMCNEGTVVCPKCKGNIRTEKVSSFVFGEVANEDTVTTPIDRKDSSKNL